MAEAGRDHGMTLAPGDWVYFAQAVFEVEEELGLPRAEAETLLRSAVAEGKIATVAVPSFAPPLAPDLPARARAPKSAEGRVLPRQARPALEPAEPEPSARAQDKEKTRPTQGELWLHTPEGAWLKVNRADLRRWFAEPAQQAVGKCPRIRAHLAALFPQGVPDPAFAPRKDLRGALLKLDPGLRPLDRATLQKAIEEYNASHSHNTPAPY